MPTPTSYIGVYADSYAPYQSSGSGGTVTPAPPSWSFNADTRILTLSHATLDASELEFSYQNAAYQQYTAALSVDAAPHPASDWKGRVKAAVGRDPSLAANSPALAAAAGQLTSQAPPESAWANGKFKQPLLEGSLRNTLATVTGTLGAGVTQVQVKVMGNIGPAVSPAFASQHILATLNATSQQLAFQSDGMAHTLPLTGVGTGAGQVLTLTLTLHDLVRQAVGSQGVAGDVLLDVLADGPITWNTAPTGGDVLVFAGDSIQGGNAAAEPLSQGMTALMRAAFAQRTPGARTLVSSYSGGSLSDVYGPGVSPADKTAWRRQLLAETATSTAGAKRRLYLAYGVNDALRTSISAADFATMLGQLLDDLHADDAGIDLFYQTPLTITTSANGRGEAELEQLRVASRNAVASRPFCRLVEGKNLVSPTNLQDGLHPTTAGHQEYFDNLMPTLSDPNTFADEFDGTSPNSVLWSWGFQSNNSADTVVANGLLTITAPTGSKNPSNPAVPRQGGLTGKILFTLVGYRVWAEIASLLAAADSLLQLVIWRPGTPEVNTAGLVYLGGNLFYATPNFQNVGHLAYDPVAHKYFGLRATLVNNQPTLCYEVSPDGTTWNQLAQASLNASELDLTSCYILLGGGCTGDPADSAHPTAGGSFQRARLQKV